MASHHDAAAMSEDKQAEELLSESGSEDSDAAEGSEEEVRASAGPGSAWQHAASPLGATPCACGRPGAVWGPATALTPLLPAPRPVPLPAGWLLDLLVLQPQGQRVLLRGGGCCAGGKAAGATAGAAQKERRRGLDPRFRPGFAVGLHAHCSYWAARPLLPQVAEDYIQDDFNLSGLSSQVLGRLPACLLGASLSSPAGCSGSNGTAVVHSGSGLPGSSCIIGCACLHRDAGLAGCAAPCQCAVAIVIAVAAVASVACAVAPPWLPLLVWTPCPSRPALLSGHSTANLLPTGAGAILQLLSQPPGAPAGAAGCSLGPLPGAGTTTPSHSPLPLCACCCVSYLQVPYYDYALDLILDSESLQNEVLTEQAQVGRWGEGTLLLLLLCPPAC